MKKGKKQQIIKKIKQTTVIQIAQPEEAYNSSYTTELQKYLPDNLIKQMKLINEFNVNSGDVLSDKPNAKTNVSVNA